MGFSIDTSGFVQALELVRTSIRQATETRLRDAGEDLIADARGKADFPYDTGSLSASGSVSDVAWDGDRALVQIGFGGPSTGPHDPVLYAVPVHEGFDLVAWGHRTARHIAGRPYLADPLLDDGPARLTEAATDILQDVASAWEGA